MSCHPAISTKTVCLTLFVAAFLHPQVEGGLTIRLLGKLSTTFVAQERPANSYQTDLWDMEFQERAKQKTKLKQFAQDEEGESVLSAEAASIGVNPPEAGEEDWGHTPGQVFLVDITEDTPFAEWQVDRSAAEHSDHFAGGPTAWVMSRVQAKTSGFGEKAPSADGPSLLTLLVAIIACMVMAGALFAER